MGSVPFSCLDAYHRHTHFAAAFNITKYIFTYSFGKCNDTMIKLNSFWSGSINKMGKMSVQTTLQFEGKWWQTEWDLYYLWQAKEYTNTRALHKQYKSNGNWKMLLSWIMMFEMPIVIESFELRWRPYKTRYIECHGFLLHFLSSNRMLFFRFSRLSFLSFYSTIAIFPFSLCFCLYTQSETYICMHFRGFSSSILAGSIQYSVWSHMEIAFRSM